MAIRRVRSVRVRPQAQTRAGAAVADRSGADRHVEQGIRPGDVTFADPKALITTATFTAPGAYVLKLTADNGADEELVHAERLGGDAAARETTRRGLHQELQDRQPVLERPRARR